MTKSMDLPYESGYLMGEWNGVVYPQKDRAFEKDIKTTQGKLSKVLFDEVDNFGDTKNSDAKNIHTFLKSTIFLKN